MCKNVEVRCPNERKHFVKGIEYNSCGIFLGAITEGSEAYYRCPMCGLIHIEYKDDNIVYHVVGKEKVEFTKHWGSVE